jgi:hypothetical protein
MKTSPYETLLHFDERVLDRMVLAVELVKQRLLRAMKALADHEIPYAVAGGNAVAAWVAKVDPAAVRNTANVDLLIARACISCSQERRSTRKIRYRSPRSTNRCRTICIKSSGWKRWFA